jgi:hypothetical protein
LTLFERARVCEQNSSGAPNRPGQGRCHARRAAPACPALARGGRAKRAALSRATAPGGPALLGVRGIERSGP